MRLLVCGGRHFGRVPSKTSHAEVNRRIVEATEEQKRLTSFLNALHEKSRIELLLHFNHRGAERLSAHWATLSSIPTKTLGQSRTSAVAYSGEEAFASLLNFEHVNAVLRLADPEQGYYLGLDDAIKALPIHVLTFA